MADIRSIAIKQEIALSEIGKLIGVDLLAHRHRDKGYEIAERLELIAEGIKSKLNGDNEGDTVRKSTYTRKVNELNKAQDEIEVLTFQLNEFLDPPVVEGDA